MLYLCAMKKEERVRRFKGGEAISSIANAAGVSRAAIIQTLKGDGCYVLGKPGRPKVKDVKVKDYSVPTYDVNEPKLSPEIEFTSIKDAPRLSKAEARRVMLAADEEAVMPRRGALPFDPSELGNKPDRKGMITRNVYRVGDRILVNDISKGGAKYYKDVGAVKEAYGVK